VKYLMDKNEFYLLGEYLSATNKSSTAFIKTITQIMADKWSKTDNPEIVAQFSKNSFFYETIYPNSLAPQFPAKLKKLVHSELGSKLKNCKVDLRQPMQNPSALYIAYMSLKTDES